MLWFDIIKLYIKKMLSADVSLKFCTWTKKKLLLFACSWVILTHQEKMGFYIDPVILLPADYTRTVFKAITVTLQLHECESGFQKFFEEKLFPEQLKF